MTCLYSRVGEPCMLQAVCPPACLCMAHCMSSVPLRGTRHGTQQGVPTCLCPRGKQSRMGANRSYATELHTTHTRPLKTLGTAYQTQSQGYENTAYQAHSGLWENCCP